MDDIPFEEDELKFKKSKSLSIMVNDLEGWMNYILLFFAIQNKDSETNLIKIDSRLCLKM